MFDDLTVHLLYAQVCYFPVFRPSSNSFILPVTFSSAVTTKLPFRTFKPFITRKHRIPPSTFSNSTNPKTFRSFPSFYLPTFVQYLFYYLISYTFMQSTHI
eukprot:UN13338